MCRLHDVFRYVLLAVILGWLGGHAQEAMDYRVILQRAFEVMATGTMEYEESAGMSLGKGRVKSIVSQQRHADGTVCRKIECLRNGGRVLRGDLKSGGFVNMEFYTDEGYTNVFLMRDKAYGIRTREGVPWKRISRGAGISGISKEVFNVPCWIIREDRKEGREGAPSVAEYVVEKSTYLVLRERIFDVNGRMMMAVERENFDLSPEFSPEHFDLPRLDELKFASDGEEYLQSLKDVTLQCALEGDAMEQNGVNPSQESWLARRWRAVCRNPGRAVFWGLLVASCLCLGTAGVLRRGRR